MAQMVLVTVVTLSFVLNKALKPYFELVPFVMSVRTSLVEFQASPRKFRNRKASGFRREGQFAWQLTILYKPLYVTSVMVASVDWASDRATDTKRQVEMYVSLMVVRFQLTN